MQRPVWCVANAMQSNRLHDGALSWCNGICHSLHCGGTPPPSMFDRGANRLTAQRRARAAVRCRRQLSIYRQSNARHRRQGRFLRLKSPSPRSSPCDGFHLSRFINRASCNFPDRHHRLSCVSSVLEPVGMRSPRRPTLRRDLNIDIRREMTPHALDERHIPGGASARSHHCHIKLGRLRSGENGSDAQPARFGERPCRLLGQLIHRRVDPDDDGASYLRGAGQRRRNDIEQKEVHENPQRYVGS